MFSKLKVDIFNRKILVFMIGNRNTQHMNNVSTIFKKKNGLMVLPAQIAKTSMVISHQTVTISNAVNAINKPQ